MMKRASDLLQTFFLKHGIEEGQQYVSFFRQWESIVGEDLAAHAEVEDIANGALVVRVDHPAWMQILHMKKDHVIAQVNRKFPDFAVSAVHMHLETERSDTERRRRRESKAIDEAPVTAGDTNDRPKAAEKEPNAESSGRLNELLERLGKQVEERNRQSQD